MRVESPTQNMWLLFRSQFVYLLQENNKYTNGSLPSVRNETFGFQNPALRIAETVVRKLTKPPTKESYRKVNGKFK